jgi:hypothetical protein
MNRKRDQLDLRTVLNKIIRNAGTHQPIGVLAGAGVSLAAPANLPTAADFKKLLAEALLQFDETPDDIMSLSDGIIYREIPFERLLQHIYDTMADTQPHIINHLLISAFGEGRPNQNHKVLSEYLVKGRIQLLLTTNFDNLFEQAGMGIEQVVTDTQWERLAKELIYGKLKSPTVAHIHGFLKRPSSLVALMNQVGREAHGPRRQVLDHLLTTGTMLFVGYSGTDEDINPVLQAYPAQSQWWLLKPGDSPDAPHKKQYQHVQLVPSRSLHGKEVFHRLFKRLSQADLLKLAGAILVSAEMYNSAIMRLARSLQHKQTSDAMLAFAVAIRSEQYFHMADKLLEKDPPREWAYWPRWVDARAFTRRHLGKFAEAAKDFKQLRKALEKRLGNVKQRNQLVSDLMQITEHEIESLLLIAAFKPSKERKKILSHCVQLLDKCRSWFSNTRKLAPTFEIYYYEAEIALLQGNLDGARNAYQFYEEKGKYWFGNDVIGLVSIRQAVVEAAQGNLWEALRKWLKGYHSAKQSASLMVRIQYFIILPALFISPRGGYWLTRILASRLYGLYGRVKFALLRFRRPALYHEISRSYEM